MWFSRLNRRISHFEASSFPRRFFANCTAANPPPMMTTLIGFISSLIGSACNRKVPPTPARSRQSREQRFDVLLQDREPGSSGYIENLRTLSEMTDDIV